MVEVGGGMTLLFLVPLLMFGVGIIFIMIAFKDRRDRRDQSVRSFSARRKHPLRHVQVAMDSARKQAREQARQAAHPQEEEPKPERKRRSGPRWLKEV